MTGANNGYLDATDTLFSLNFGSNFIYLHPGYYSYSYNEFWSAWIDFNRNGQFETNEQVVSFSSGWGGAYSFNLPYMLEPGETRMSIAMRWGGSASPCGVFTWGEVEDYTVLIPEY